MNGTHYEPFNIFIASPSDVKTERRMAEQAIWDIHNSCRNTLGLFVDCSNWESLPPLTPSPTQGRIQDVIIEEVVKSCNVFVLILRKRYGSVEPGHTESNTEREINTALDMMDKGRNIMFLSYFCDVPSDSDPGEQEKRVKALQERLRARGLWYRVYQHPEQFKDYLTHDLYHTILKFSVSTSKQKALKCFWQLGIAEGQTHPQLAIAYPPLDRAYMRRDDPDKIWFARLVPHVAFEDFKAIQKIEKTLRLVGFRNFDACTIQCLPQHIQDANRVWICLPRNEPGFKQLLLYSEEAGFRFTPRQERTEAKIFWRHDADSTWMEIHSPLRKYLLEQRKDSPGGDWKAELGRIVAKDFAVLARFSDRRDEHPTTTGTLKDYFFAGIRGLGTWGAGWFLDRRYKAFLQYADSEDAAIQLLLEVTYCNERIVGVRDVSNEPDSYFRNENSLRTVRHWIRELGSSE